jgi:UDP-GlcNAc:undecaprenyl-phosphate GlcNAc-1-phosphate transferase
LSLVLTPWARDLAIRLRLVDRPDGRRKLHARAIPVAGGPAILAAVCGGVLTALALPGPLSAQARAVAPHLVGLLLAGLVICGVGLVDDFVGLRGRHKLLGQLAAVAVVIACGVRIQVLDLLGWDLDLGLLAVPFTAFVLLGAINALNLIDGMDGLLSTVALIICLALGAIAWFGGRDVTACVALALAGALAAFLRYNFPPATVFLGDSGSMLIGLTVGVLAISSSLKGPATVALAAPTALLAVPILDTTAAILRRKLTGRSIYSTDRGHLHHRLLDRLAGPRSVLLLVSACCLVTAAGAFVSLLLKNELAAVLSAVAVVGMLLATGLFGNSELLLVVQRLRGVVGAVVRPRPVGEAREVEVRLQGSVEWRELWDRILACAPRLNLARLRLDVNAPSLGEGYHALWVREHKEEAGLWSVQVPLAAAGRVIGELAVAGSCDREPAWEKIAALARMVQEFEAAASLLTAGVGAGDGVREGADLPFTVRPSSYSTQPTS